MSGIDTVRQLKSTKLVSIDQVVISASVNTQSVEVADYEQGSMTVEWSGTNAAAKGYPQATIDGIIWTDICDVDFDISTGSGTELISFLYFPWKEVRIRVDALTNTSGTLETLFYGVDKKG